MSNKFSTLTCLKLCTYVQKGKVRSTRMGWIESLVWTKGLENESSKCLNKKLAFKDGRLGK